MSEKKKVGLDIARSSTLVQEYQVASWERNELPTTPELTAIDEKIAKDPENAELHKERGLLLAGLGYYREAAECYSRAIAINPFNWEYYRHRAHRFVSCGYFADGAADFTIASRLNPNDWNVWYHLGLSYFLLGMYDKADWAYTRCAALNKTADDICAVTDWHYMTLKRLGIEVTFVSPEASEDEIQAAFRPNTKALFGETIANPALTVLDIEKFAKAAHAHGVPRVVDNTFPTPVNCRPFEGGADIVTHSTTTDDAEVDGYKLMWFAVHTSNMTTSTSVVRLELDGQQFEAVCSGDGPVDAAFEAIDQIIRPVEHSFDLYRINSISPGKDTMGDVSVKLSCDNRTFSGRGLHTNIVEASVRAYISAMNKLRAYAARRAKGEV